MPDLTTTNYSWTLPSNNADSDTWGTILNADLVSIDADLSAVAGVANAAMPLAGGSFTGSISGTSASFSGAVAATGGFTGALTGSVTGDVTGSASACTGNAATATALAAAATLSFIGDAAGALSFSGASASGALTLATVNSAVGAFGSASAVPIITVNAKGLVTAVSTASLAGYAPLAGPSLTGAATSANTPASSDSSTKIANTAFVQSAIANMPATLAAPGSVQIGPLILNWGTYALGSGGGATENVSFVAAFPNAFLLGWVSVDNAATQMIGITSGLSTTSGMQIQKGAGDATARTGSWFAIGH